MQDGLCEIARLKAGVCRPLGEGGSLTVAERGGAVGMGRRASVGRTWMTGVFGLGELEMLLADLQHDGRG